MRKFFVYLFIGVMALAVAPQGVLATALPIANPSFEADIPDSSWLPDVSNPRQLRGKITNWTLSSPALDAKGFANHGVHRFTTAEYPLGVPDPNNVAYVHDNSYISQVISGYSVIAGHIYTFEAMVGLRADRPKEKYNISYALELLSGGNQLAYLKDDVAIPGTFELASLVYPATQDMPGELEIRLWSFGGQSNFDVVTLSNSTPPPPQTPIPGSVALMLTGLVGMSALGLRFRKN